MDFSPAIECCLHRFNFLQYIGPTPFSGGVIIGYLPLLMHLLEGVRDDMDVLKHRNVIARRGTRGEVLIEIVTLCCANSRHRSMD